MRYPMPTGRGQRCLRRPTLPPSSLRLLAASGGTLRHALPCRASHPGFISSAMSNPLESTSLVSVGAVAPPNNVSRSRSVYVPAWATPNPRLAIKCLPVSTISGIALIGGNTCGKVTTDRQITNPALTEVLHLRDPLAAPFLLLVSLPRFALGFRAYRHIGQVPKDSRQRIRRKRCATLDGRTLA